MELQKVRTDLERWRKTRPYPRSKIPYEIWDKILGLTKKYPLLEIAKQLNFNHSDLKKKMKELGPAHISQSNSFFVPVKKTTEFPIIQSPTNPLSIPAVFMEFETKAGIIVRIFQ